MAFTAILRKSASTVAPLARRIVGGGRRNCHCALFNALNNHASHGRPSVVPSMQCYSTATDSKERNSTDSLLKIIESEIKVAQEIDIHDPVEIPESFPFKIDDDAGKQVVVLTREFEGELIKVVVNMPNLDTSEDVGADDDDDTEKLARPSLPLTVTISKKSGPSLEFSCVAYPDEIAIDNLSVRKPENSEDQLDYDGPGFYDLDENLRKTFHKYLEIRGINPSTTNFLHEYMMNKDSREFLGWLSNLKKFIEA